MNLENISLLQILAILSASAAGGMRIGLPLLIVGIARLDQLWSNVPFLSNINPQIIVGILTSWTLFELLGTKKLIGLRIVQIVQLLFSPFVGAFMAIAVAALIEVKITPLWLLGLTGGLLALVLKLVLVGWFFRWGKMPVIIIILEDLLSGILVVFALKAPENGGLIAMILLWLALRSSNEWKHRFKIQKAEKN
ncbi:DUF4126 domain-containing protein [Geminocystis sp. CENA526]|uniref:DUF4126 domain-containing protein n=1 Tax=Geminocystis sp. CENA526 TaxID=1355871 RepID=UPI003D6DD262